MVISETAYTRPNFSLVIQWHIIYWEKALSEGKINLSFDPQTKIYLQRYTRNDHTTLLQV